MTTKHYLRKDDSGYGSHIPALQQIFQHITVNTALELGSGYFSTSFLLEHCKRLTTVEMQNQHWLDLMRTEFKEAYPNWFSMYDEKVTAFIQSWAYDFVLVDGSAPTRAVGVVHYMQRGVPTIVAHDTESPWYGYSVVTEYQEKLGYYGYTFKNPAPWTTVYTTERNLIKFLKTLP